MALLLYLFVIMYVRLEFLNCIHRRVIIKQFIKFEFSKPISHQCYFNKKRINEGNDIVNAIIRCEEVNRHQSSHV